MDAVPVPPPATTPEPPARDWSELPQDALTVVLSKLGAVELLLGTGSLVCRSWHEAARVPDVWRSVDMAAYHRIRPWTAASVMHAMAKAAVDRADGQLEAFKGRSFVNNNLLKYVGDRSPSLKCLCLVSCSRVTNKGFTELITKCPLLEQLVIRDCRMLGSGVFELASKACPQLKRLELRAGRHYWRSYGRKDEVVPGIAPTMRELRHLTLEGSVRVTGKTLAAIVGGCPRLELLDVSDCSGLAGVDDGELMAVRGRIKTLALPCSWWLP